MRKTDDADIQVMRETKEMLLKEKAGYETEITYYQSLSSNSRIRLAMEMQLNKDMCRQIRVLQKEKLRAEQLEKQSGIDQATIDDFQSTKRLLKVEQDKRKRLMKKIDWYNKEIESAQSIQDDEIKESEKVKDVRVPSNNTTPVFLPPINIKSRPGIISVRPAPELDGAFSQYCYSRCYDDGTTTTQYLSTTPKEKKEGYKKFYRKVKRIVREAF